MKIFRFTLFLIILIFLISSKSHSQEPFIITSEALEIIPNKHLSFLEDFDETVSLLTLHQNIIGNNLFAEDAIVLIYHHYHSLHGDKLAAVILKA